MKKIIFLSLAILMLLLVYKTNNNDNYVIPHEAIRFRIVANSNSYNDQFVKMKVKEGVTSLIKKISEESSNIEEQRNKIKENLTKLNQTVNEILKENNSNLQYKINYGDNYFPEKEYDGVIYEEGEYESLVITLGNGLGDNWWCVMFPPICFAEYNGEKIEYKVFIKEMFNKYILSIKL